MSSTPAGLEGVIAKVKVGLMAEPPLFCALAESTKMVPNSME
jgi:hypothetical protein